MKTIWKYPINSGITKLELPSGAKFLSLQAQFGNPVAWFEVDPLVTMRESWQLATHGTGHEFNGEYDRFLGTFQVNNGALVFHVFKL